MKKIVILFAFLFSITISHATVILCNDEQGICHVIHYANFDGDADACCWEFYMNPGSGWDCTHGSVCQTFKGEEGVSGSRKSSDSGLKIIDDKIYSDGALIATMLNPSKEEDIVSFSFQKPFDIESFDFHKNVSTKDGIIYIGNEPIEGIKLIENHKAIEYILTISKKEETTTIDDIYFYENAATPNNLSFILPKDIVSVHILDEQLNIVQNYKINANKMLEKVDYSNLMSGKYFITFVSKNGKFSRQIIKI